MALLHRKNKSLKVEEIDIGNSAASEDALDARVECKDGCGRSEKVIVVVAYMTVEGERAARENSGKYSLLKKLVWKKYSITLSIILTFQEKICFRGVADTFLNVSL